jgi:hypothetical protein
MRFNHKREVGPYRMDQGPGQALLAPAAHKGHFPESEGSFPAPRGAGPHHSKIPVILVVLDAALLLYCFSIFASLGSWARMWPGALFFVASLNSWDQGGDKSRAIMEVNWVVVSSGSMQMTSRNGKSLKLSAHHGPGRQTMPTL